MSRRPKLEQLRRWILEDLDEEWRPVDYFQLRGEDWYRCALTLERLAADGAAELRAKPGSGRRWFRRAA